MQQWVTLHGGHSETLDVGGDPDNILGESRMGSLPRGQKHSRGTRSTVPSENSPKRIRGKNDDTPMHSPPPYRTPSVTPRSGQWEFHPPPAVHAVGRDEFESFARQVGEHFDIVKNDQVACRDLMVGHINEVQKNLQKVLEEHTQALGKVIGDSMVGMQNQVSRMVESAVSDKFASLAPAGGGRVRGAGGNFAHKKQHFGIGKKGRRPV